jgi:hypothetical protein
LTRSHHIDRQRFTSLSTMVFPYSKRVPPKSFVQSRIHESLSFSCLRDSQGLHRPRFSFFIFTCQTARGEAPLPNREPCEDRFRRQMTTDGVSVVRFTHPNEELHGHENMPWQSAKTAPRSVGRFISPPDQRCQRLLSTNRRVALPVSRRKEASIFAGFTPYLSHNPATF